MAPKVAAPKAKAQTSRQDCAWGSFRDATNVPELWAPPYSHPRLLRDHLAFKSTWIYYAAMIIDPILRFNWIFYAIYGKEIQHSALLSFFVSFSFVPPSKLAAMCVHVVLEDHLRFSQVPLAVTTSRGIS